jgi:hypothetical protein
MTPASADVPERCMPRIITADRASEFLVSVIRAVSFLDLR